MSFSVDDFKTKGLQYGGARPSLFEVSFSFPSDVTGSYENTKYLARSSFLPSSMTTSMNVSYLGRIFKFAGERTYPQWTVTFLNDEDFALRNIIEKWLDNISGNKKLGRSLAETDAELNTNKSGYKGSAIISQFSKSGIQTKNYTFHGLFPIVTTDIAVDWGSTNAIEEFTVTFDYQYHTTNYNTIIMSSDNSIKDDTISTP